jgi:hypothetical protein
MVAVGQRPHHPPRKLPTRAPRRAACPSSSSAWGSRSCCRASTLCFGLRVLVHVGARDPRDRIYLDWLGRDKAVKVSGSITTSFPCTIPQVAMMVASRWGLGGPLFAAGLAGTCGRACPWHASSSGSTTLDPAPPSPNLVKMLCGAVFLLLVHVQGL